MILGANGLAVAGNPPDGVQVNRIIGNGSEAGQYLPGSPVAVELDYTVTGMQYAVTITEMLPKDWQVVDSNIPFSLVDKDNNIYAWNISSPLTGVKSGSIKYLVWIPAGATQPSYTIDGGSAWFSSLDKIKSQTPTSSTPTIGATTILVGNPDSNSPTIWIANPIEEIGDGDGHMEPGEWANYSFLINDSNTIASYQVFVNDVLYTNVTYPSPVSLPAQDVNGYIHVNVSSPSVNVTIDATDANGNTNVFSNIIYVPNYDYTAWMSGEWNGFTVQSAAYEPGSTIDSGWITLHGGNPIKIPGVVAYYNGPGINKQYSGSLSDIPLYSLIGMSGISGDANFTLNATPHGVTLPYKTWPIYTEGSADVSATFTGTQVMHYKNFNVILVNASEVYGNLDLTNLSSVIGCLKSMTPEEIMKGKMDNIAIPADQGSCDFTVNSANMPDLGNMNEGVYALVVLDENVPNTPCLVGVAPIIVTKTGLQTTEYGPMPMPGDPVNLHEQLDSPAASQYIYMVMMVPENEYNATLTVDTPLDASLSGTTFSFDGLSFHEQFHVATDGTKADTNIMIHSITTGKDYTITPDDLSNKDKLKGILMDEVNGSNASYMISDTQTTSSLDMSILTRPTMPTGNYTLLSVVMDRNTGCVAAVNQTTIMLGATFTYNLIPDWNLISVPLNVQDNSIDGFFTPSVSSQIVDLWEWNASGQHWAYWSADPASPFWNYEHIKTIDAGQGYWVNMNSGASFTIHGSVPSSAPNTLTPLHTDWNLVGLTGLTPSTPEVMYPTAVDVWEWKDVQMKWKYWSADPASPFWNYEHISTIQPGVGTWVNI